MIYQRSRQEVKDWHIVFHPACLNKRLGKLIPGHFKHVSAFAFVESCRVWVLYDVSLRETKIVILPEGIEAANEIMRWSFGCSILSMTAAAQPKWRPRFGFWCVPAMRHLLGLAGGAVLTPDQLWDEMLDKGASVLSDHGRQRKQRIFAGRADDGAHPAATAAGSRDPSG